MSDSRHLKPHVTISLSFCLLPEKWVVSWLICTPDSVCLASHSFFLWIIFPFRCEPASPEEFQQKDWTKKKTYCKNSGLAAQVFIWKCVVLQHLLSLSAYFQACTYMCDFYFSSTLTIMQNCVFFSQRWAFFVHHCFLSGMCVKGWVWLFLLRHSVQQALFEGEYNTYCHLMLTVATLFQCGIHHAYCMHAFNCAWSLML